MRSQFTSYEQLPITLTALRLYKLRLEGKIQPCFER